MLVGLERRIGGAGARGEERDRVSPLEQGRRVDLFGSHAQPLAARHEQRQIRAGPEQLLDVGRRCHQVLEVVEQHQHDAVGDPVGRRACQAKRASDRRQNLRRLGGSGQRHPPDTRGKRVRGGGGRLQAEPGLAAASRSRDRHES